MQFLIQGILVANECRKSGLADFQVSKVIGSYAVFTTEICKAVARSQTYRHLMAVIFPLFTVKELTARSYGKCKKKDS